MGRPDFEEQEDCCRLLIDGGRVTSWRVDDDGDYRLELSWPVGRGRAPDDRMSLAAAVVASRLEGAIAEGACVRDVILWNSGALTVVFEGGRLEVSPNVAYEAWEVRGPPLLAFAPWGGPGEPSIWLFDEEPSSPVGASDDGA
jgi:hypothetical protein